MTSERRRLLRTETKTHRTRRAIASPLPWLTAWSPALLVMASIFALSARPELGHAGWLSEIFVSWFGQTPWLMAWLPAVKLLDPLAANVGHLAAYGALAIALCWGARRQWPRFSHPPVAAWFLAVAYGVSDEWHQRFVPGRHADPWDLLLDGIGAAVALAALSVWRRYRT